MTEPSDETPHSPLSSWRTPASAKAKNAVQRAVTALLDELAPERVLTRSTRLPGAVEQHRTPSGCVLQAPMAAVSVSWFAATSDDLALGELHVVVWNGVVTRVGTPKRREGATLVSETVLKPNDRPLDGIVWRTADGSEYDTAGLAAFCTKLLDDQVARA